MAKKYFIADLAKALGIEEASTRVRLRAQKVKREGKAYEWDKEAFDALVAKLKGGKGNGKKEEKSAKPAKKKKPAREKTEAEDQPEA